MEAPKAVKFGIFLLLTVAMALHAKAARVNLEVFENAHHADVSGLDIWVDVLDVGDGMIDFVFHNDSSIFSSVTSIYFEDGLGGYLDDGFVYDQSAGVKFEQVKKEKDPPGGNNIGWSKDTLVQFDRKSSRGGGDWGINPDDALPQTLTLRFDSLVVGGVQQLVAALLGGDARIAAHIQRLGDGDHSVSAVTRSIPDEGGFGSGQRIVPVPAAAWSGLATLALISLRGLRRVH